MLDDLLSGSKDLVLSGQQMIGRRTDTTSSHLIPMVLYVLELCMVP